MKNLSTGINEETLGKLTFPDYEKFFTLTSKILNVLNKVAPKKTIRVKNNTNEWFDGETAEKIAARNKLFRKF